MSWEALGAIAEMFGAVGVILTLAYLAVQVRQNTTAQSSSTWQAIQDGEQNFDAYIASPENASLFLRGWEGGTGALTDPVERHRFQMMMKMLIDITATHHYQYNWGSLILSRG